MQFRAFVVAAAAVVLSAVGVDARQGFLGTAYPFKCYDLCGPLVTISQNECYGHDKNCFCLQKESKRLVPLCEACSYNARNTPNGATFYPLIKEIQQACDYKTTSITQGAAAATAAPVLAGGAMAAMAVVAAL